MRLAVGLAFAAFGILLELGLDQVVDVAPWLIVSFVAGLLAAILGGVLGGLAAALVGFVGQVSAVPAWVPAVRGIEAAGWPFELVTAVAAFALGIGIRQAILRGDLWLVRRPRSELPPGTGPAGAEAYDREDPGAARFAAPTAADLSVVTAAIRDFGAVRTPIQIADALARHVGALCGATTATVYLVTDERSLRPVGRFGAVDPAAPERLSLEEVEPGAPAGDARLVPIVAGATRRPQMLGVIRLGVAEGRPTRSGPLLDVVVQLAADALERTRLDEARRSAEAGSAGAVRRLAILGALGLDLVGGTTLDEVAETLLDFAVDDLAAGFAAVHVADDAAGGFRLVASRGLPAGLIAGLATIQAEAASPIVHAAEAREPVEIVDEEGWRVAYPRTSNVLGITGARAISAIPMEAGGIVHGVLSIGWRTAGDRSNADHGLLAAVAAQGAQALERAILHAHDEDARTFQEAFIGVVSHELRTPITTILAGSRLLKRRLDGDKRAAELSDDIEIEADRLTRIVDDLLVLSRLERHQMTIGDYPVHLDHLLTRVIRSEANRWPEHRFDIEASPTRHVVLGEETYVEQVLRNMISNAAKYSPVGSTIHIAIEDAPAGEVLVRVLDEGPGVAPAEVDELFSLFYRSPSTSASAAGAGIGLFVSRRLISEMGGRVWAKPRPGGGSEFGFSLASYPIDEPEPDELVGTGARD